MTNALTYEHNFAHLVSRTEAAVHLGYTRDHALWPWLALPSAHPVLVEKYQYFGAMTASWELEVFKPEMSTALTQFQWAVTDQALAGVYGTRGTCEPWAGSDGLGFSLSVEDDEGVPLYRTRGQGFIFSDRDFVAFRENCRQTARAEQKARELSPAEPCCLGLGVAGVAFVERPSGTGVGAECWCRVPTEGGFTPQHPFHTGSGDHVNAAQLLDCGLQAAHGFLGAGEPWAVPLLCTGGEARFARYVELDLPFCIRLLACTGDRDQRVQLQFSQGGRDNVWLELHLQAPA